MYATLHCNNGHAKSFLPGITAACLVLKFLFRTCFYWKYIYLFQTSMCKYEMHNSVNILSKRNACYVYKQHDVYIQWTFLAAGSIYSVVAHQQSPLFQSREIPFFCCCDPVCFTVAQDTFIYSRTKPCINYDNGSMPQISFVDCTQRCGRIRKK